MRRHRTASFQWGQVLGSATGQTPFPNTQRAVSDDDQEVEVVEDDPEVQVVDMSMEEQPHSLEEAGANARSPSPSPESPTPGPLGFCRDELYETNEEAEIMLDEAEDGEEGQRSPPYVAPRAQSPSPRALAAEYTQVPGASDPYPATLESLERGRKEGRMAARTRMILDRERRDNKAREERSRSRSRPRSQEQQMRGEEEKRRCRSATTWNPPSDEGASVTSSASEWVKEDPIRCTSPHNCRRAEAGGCRSQVRDPNRRSRSATPEDRRRSLASQESLDRCTRMMTRERERMKEVWDRMRKEQAALMEARDGMAKLTAKGITELWRLKTRMSDQLKDYEKRIATAASEDNQSRETRKKAARVQARSSTRPNKEATPVATGCAGCAAPDARHPAGTESLSAPQ